MFGYWNGYSRGRRKGFSKRIKYGIMRRVIAKKRIWGWNVIAVADGRCSQYSVTLLPMLHVVAGKLSHWPGLSGVKGESEELWIGIQVKFLKMELKLTISKPARI
jgi:hypothetical protein